MRVALEDVVPFEAVDLRAAQPGVEGDRVGETVLRLERGEQRRRLGRESDAQARLLVVGRQLDQAQRVARDETTRRRRRPGVDVRRDRDVLRDGRARQARAGELVDPPLPVELGDLARAIRARTPAAGGTSASGRMPSDRRVGVRLALAAAPADAAPLDAVEPLLAQRLERRADLRQFREMVRALASCAASHASASARLLLARCQTGLLRRPSPTRGRARTACSGNAPTASA